MKLVIVYYIFFFRRENSIEEIIGRNVELPIGDINKINLSEKEKFLVEKLNIKEGIIYNAKGILAATHKKYVIFYFFYNYY